jgi:hypothetical protein
MRAPRRSRPIEVDLEEVPAGSPPPAEVQAAEVAPAEPVDEPQPRTKTPLYPRLLRLRHIAPNAWQRAALGEGALGVGVLLAMADLASAWTIVALPVAVAGVVKAHDALQGLLDRGHASGDDPQA